ncbi:MAG: chromosome segregation protein SMC [Bryobacteraceae bacterium]
MLKLKRVEVQGFKSFYDRTEMKFSGTGIAAIVGPNGCGKSNLSDAISWVLGEQSAKSLRGARMEDVIFAGTRDRKPLGMATVTMTLIPDREPLESINLGSGEAVSLEERVHTNGHAIHGSLKAEAAKTTERQGEVTITRRLYRSGESEYLMNGKLARLRDIQDLFLGTGLGPESYAIIEQGRIGQILSNRPQDRRNVIEEAAGITKFKTRKRLAEGKLESAKQNLARVFDILEEVTRQVNSLKRQAAKTKRYSELKSEARTYLRQVLAAKFRMLEREAARLAIELNLASAELQNLKSEIARCEQDQTAIVEASYANEQHLTQARTVVSDLHLEAERTRGRLEYQTKEIQQIEERLTYGQKEKEALGQKWQEGAADLERQTSELAALDAKCAQERQRLGAKSNERQERQTSFSKGQHALEAVRQNLLQLMSEAATLRNRITHAEAQLASIDRQMARARTEEQQADAGLARIETQRAELSQDLAVHQTRLNSVTDQRKAAEQDLQQKRAQLNEAGQALDRLRGEFSRVKARKDSIEEVLEHRSYTTETVKRFFTAVEQGNTQDLQPVGVLADFLEVDPQLEKATEEFLHDELEYVVVRDWRDAERGIEVMRTDLNGRATFLVESTGEANAPAGELSQSDVEAGILTRLTGAVRFTDGFSTAPANLLPRIANCYVVADRGIAQKFAVEYPHCWFLVTDGVSYHGQAVSGGKKTGAGPLALKRELREMSQLERVKQDAMNAAQADFVALESAISQLANHVEHLRADQQAEEKDLLAMDHESRKLAEEFERVRASLSRARTELDQLSRDGIELERNLERDREALANSELTRKGQEQALESAREQLSLLEAEVARVTEEHASLRAHVASLEERQRSLAENRARLAAQVEDFRQRQEQIRSETERLIAERAQFLNSNKGLEAKSAELSSSISVAVETVRELAEQESGLRAQLAGIEEELKRLRTQLQTAQDKRSDLQVALARAESDLKHLDETAARELDTNLEQLIKGIETVPDGPQLESIENKYTEAQRKIEALGPVNPEALAEFEEAQTRQEFLNSQRQDLLDSIRDTEKAIHQIDDESRKRFAEAFHAINANFREMFSTLFGGGLGEMRLTDEDNIAESGLDIVASPPGKKLQSVLLLSGGEKSLTAMALLMAIFQYTPSPFCVLDEVDAPLDEPNIERLTRLLKEMSQQTQFIVITHAKRTMEAAQNLYGVTMQEAGISKLVSVKFDRANEGRPAKDRVRAAPEETLERTSSRS